jgi:uncharacterized membrane protein YhhN
MNNIFTPRTVFLSIATAVMAGLLVLNSVYGWGLPRFFLKQGASCFFLATAWSAGALQHTPGRWIFAGLFFSWWGDFFLLYSGDAYFLAGLASFLLGHALYSIGFFVFGVSWKHAALTVPAILVLLGLIMPDIWSHVPSNLKPAVGAYIAVISAMVIFSGGAAARGNILFLIGAILFFVSDIAVARDAFDVSPVPSFTWGLPLYYAGQVVLAWASGVRRPEN